MTNNISGPIELYTYQGVTQYVRRTTYDTDISSMAEVRTYDIGDEPIETCIDIGSHIGSFACLIRHLWPDSEILAIEPELENFDILVRNAASASPGIVSLKLRVGYNPQPAAIVLHPNHSTCHKIVLASELTQDQLFTEAPEQVSLEETLEWFRGQRASLLKIDAEGAELDILMNCESSTLQKFKRIVGEFHNGYEFFMSGIGARLQSLDFIVTGQQDPLAHSTFVAINQNWKE